jgi:hypothetical protein
LSLAPGNGEDAAAGTSENRTSDPEWRMHFRHIEERIDKLDKAVSTAVDLLQGMLLRDKPNAGSNADR